MENLDNQERKHAEHVAKEILLKHKDLREEDVNNMVAAIFTKYPLANCFTHNPEKNTVSADANELIQRVGELRLALALALAEAASAIRATRELEGGASVQ